VNRCGHPHRSYCVNGAAEMAEGDGNRRQPIFLAARGQEMRGEEVIEMLTCRENGAHERKAKIGHEVA